MFNVLHFVIAYRGATPSGSLSDSVSVAEVNDKFYDSYNLTYQSYQKNRVFLSMASRLSNY